MSNSIKTVLLLGLLTGLFVIIGRALGGQTGMVIALILAAVMNFASYWYSDKIVLSMYDAQPVEESSAPGIYRMVGELAGEAGLPTPRVYLIEDDSPNAFATGRDPEHAVVAVTRGITELLSPRELRGVISHELAHVKHRDILVGSVAATLAGAVMVLANMAQFAAIFRGHDDEEGPGLLGSLAIAIVSPIAAALIQMAISRSREYLADRGGAEMSRDPESLARALEKLAAGNERVPMEDARPQTAHMFIVNPLSGGFASLFSTHPPIEERVARLRAMGISPRTATPPPPPPPPPY